MQNNTVAQNLGSIEINDGRSFLQVVVPDDGVKFITEWLPKPEHPRGGVMIHHPCETHAAMLERAEAIDAKGRNAYFASATFKEVKYKKKGNFEFVTGREQSNVQSLKSLFMDFDVGKRDAGGNLKADCYETQKNALAALKIYLDATGLPVPVVVSSGYGIHAYWVLAESVTSDEWNLLVKFQRLVMRDVGVRFDPSRDEDCASLLRPVGTHNYKDGSPAMPVKVLRGKVNARSAEEYARLFRTYVEKHGLAVPTSPHAMGLPSINSDLIVSPDYPPSDANRIADTCKQLELFRETGGESEPIWYACLGLLKHCSDGEKYAHEWGAKYAKYNEAETSAKMEQWSYGPTTCDKFRDINPKGCEGCTHACTSPIQLGADSVAEAAKQDNVFDWFNSRYAVAPYLGSVLILETECPGIVGYMKERDFGLLYRNKTITVPHGSGTKQVGAVSAWLASEMRRTYPEGAHFAPGQTLPVGQFNTWRGWPVTPVKGAWSYFREFMYEVICAGDEAVFGYVRKLLARWVQFPHMPGHVAIFMRGDKGVGKSFFARKIGSLFEPHAIYVGDRSLLTGTFTGHFREVNFAFFDEAVWNGSHEDANRLKALITEKDMLLHPKGLTPYRVDNSMHIIVATNDEFAASASHDERRVCMLSPSNVRRIDRKYFSQVEEAWNNGEQAAFLYDLLKTDLAGFNPENIPQTDELTNQKVLSLPEGERVIFELLRDGIHWPDGGGPGKVLKQALAEQLGERSSGIEKRQADTRMGNAVKRIFGTSVHEKREAAGARHRVWILPPLTDARKLFQQYLNVTALNWE